MLNISIFWSQFILFILLAALIIAFEITTSSDGKRAIKRNYQRVIEPVMMILYGTIWVGIVRRPLGKYQYGRYQVKISDPDRRFPGFGYPKKEDK